MLPIAPPPVLSFLAVGHRFTGHVRSSLQDRWGHGSFQDGPNSAPTGLMHLLGTPSSMQSPGRVLREGSLSCLPGREPCSISASQIALTGPSQGLRGTKGLLSAPGLPHTEELVSSRNLGVSAAHCVMIFFGGGYKHRTLKTAAPREDPVSQDHQAQVLLLQGRWPTCPKRARLTLSGLGCELRPRSSAGVALW